MLSRFRIVGRHCRSMGLVIHAHPLAPDGRMTHAQQRAYHHQKIDEHTRLGVSARWAGNIAKAHGDEQQARADLATDPHVRNGHLAAVNRNHEEASRRYADAERHEAEVTDHRKALDNLLYRNR